MRFHTPDRAFRSRSHPTRPEPPSRRDQRHASSGWGEAPVGLSRHLSAYGISSAHAALDSVQFAGQVYELAWRLRNAGLSLAARIEAIAVEAAIGRRILLREVLPTLEQLGWIECHFDDQQRLLSVDAFIPPRRELVDAAAGLLDIVAATSVQRAALALLRATTLQPLEERTALDAAAAFGDEAATEALRHLLAIQLIKKVTSDDGRAVVFNPNVWVGNDKVVTQAALRAEDAGVRANVGALLEEVAQSPGIPEVHVTATEKRWIDFAVSMGLIQRSVVQTSNGDEQRFLFSPHLGRDPFGIAADDPSGHVRQLVGSMIYASTFAARNRLRSPGAFLSTLIRDGVAGDVPEIGEDYPMLETAGTIRVVPGKWQEQLPHGAHAVRRGRQGAHHSGRARTVGNTRILSRTCPRRSTLLHPFREGAGAARANAGH